MIPDFDGIADGCFDRVPRKIPYTSPLRNIHRQREGLQSAEPYRIETIPPFVAPPWWLGPTIHIEEEACARSTHDREATKKENVCIYTDGSSIVGHVGAAAVCLDTGQTSKTYIGTDAISTVYAAELQGINLALAISEAEADARNPR